MNSLRVLVSTRVVAVVCCLLLAVAMQAQQTSGAISGTVKDKQGAVVPGAKVTLTDQVMAGQREQTSSPEGNFTFEALAPSTYTVSVEAAGFKKWDKKDIPLSPNARLGVTDIELEVGSQTESITVEATAVQLQTESAEKNGTVTGQMFQELSSRGRSFMDLLYTMPGVVGPNQFSANFNGQRDETNSFRVDGIVNVDSGVQQCCGSWVNVDMIAEMKVTINGAPADMGRMSGAQINVVTKSGSKEFHGDLYFFKRAEWMNANSWTNKISNTPKGRDRNNIGGYTLGGRCSFPQIQQQQGQTLLLHQHGAVEEHEPQQRQPAHADRSGKNGRLLKVGNQQRRGGSSDRPSHPRSVSRQHSSPQPPERGRD